MVKPNVNNRQAAKRKKWFQRQKAQREGMAWFGPRGARRLRWTFSKRFPALSLEECQRVWDKTWLELYADLPQYARADGLEQLAKQVAQAAFARLKELQAERRKQQRRKSAAEPKPLQFLDDEPADTRTTDSRTTDSRTTDSRLADNNEHR